MAHNMKSMMITSCPWLIHIYYGNLQAWGSKSCFYCEEAAICIWNILGTKIRIKQEQTELKVSNYFLSLLWAFDEHPTIKNVKKLQKKFKTKFINHVNYQLSYKANKIHFVLQYIIIEIVNKYMII